MNLFFWADKLKYLGVYFDSGKMIKIDILPMMRKFYGSASGSGAFLQATSRVPRWWIGERPPDMAASCDIYK